MKYTALLCILASFSYTIEKETDDRICPYQFLRKDWYAACEKDLSIEFPCSPEIIESIRKNMPHPPGYYSQNEFNWLPEYKIRSPGIDHIIGAALIRKCAHDLQLNLVSAPDKRLARINRTELAVYNEPPGNYYFTYRDFIVQRRIPSVDISLSLAHVKQLCSLFQATGYKLEDVTSVINGADGIIYLDCTSYLYFSQATTQYEFDCHVLCAMTKLKKIFPLQQDARAWLEQNISSKLQQLKANKDPNFYLFIDDEQ